VAPETPAPVASADAASAAEPSALRNGGDVDALAVTRLTNCASLASMFEDPTLANASTGNSTDVAECVEDEETWLTGSVEPSVDVSSQQQAFAPPPLALEAAPEPASESAVETGSEVVDTPSPASDELATPSFASASGFSSFSSGIDDDISTEQMNSSGGDDGGGAAESVAVGCGFLRMFWGV